MHAHTATALCLSFPNGLVMNIDFPPVAKITRKMSERVIAACSQIKSNKKLSNKQVFRLSPPNTNKIREGPRTVPKVHLT